MRAELVSHVHNCNKWVRGCGQNLYVIMESYAYFQMKACGEHYMGEYSDSDDDDYGCSCRNCCPRRYRTPPEPSAEWLAACPALAWANMHVAGIKRPSLAMLLGPE